MSWVPISTRCTYELWRTPADNARLVAAILAAVAQPRPEPAEEDVRELRPDKSGRPQPSVDRRAFMQPGGLIPPKDPFYLAREADQVVERLAAEPGITLVIKAPRQMGKSSLLVRYMTSGMAAGKRLAFIDLQALAETQLADYPTFLACFAATLLKRLGLKADELPVLESGLDVTSLVESRVFPELDQPLLLAFDEADRLLGRPWQTDFFGMLRVWHNSRWLAGWSGVDMALVIATEPYLLVAEEHQSPFNVGEVVAPAPFRPEAVATLNEGYGAPLRAGECAEALPALPRAALSHPRGPAPARHHPGLHLAHAAGDRRP